MSGWSFQSVLSAIVEGATTGPLRVNLGFALFSCLELDEIKKIDGSSFRDGLPSPRVIRP